LSLRREICISALSVQDDKVHQNIIQIHYSNNNNKINNNDANFIKLIGVIQVALHNKATNIEYIHLEKQNPTKKTFVYDEFLILSCSLSNGGW